MYNTLVILSSDVTKRDQAKCLSDADAFFMAYEEFIMAWNFAFEFLSNNLDLLRAAGVEADKDFSDIQLDRADAQSAHDQVKNSVMMILEQY